MQYLVIVLDDMSTSYCHYGNPKKQNRLISLDDLKKGIIFGMKENLMIQFVCPDYDLPEEYKVAINDIDHSIITSAEGAAFVDSDVIVLNGLETSEIYTSDIVKSYVLRLNKEELFSGRSQLEKLLLNHNQRLNIVITDLESFTDDDFTRYRDTLAQLSEFIETQYLESKAIQLNVLTDRIALNEMNNCNAGWKSITLAPDGKFYVCPAFYFDSMPAVGDLKEGLDIKNPQLYKLSHAPLCRDCDAFQCRRCIWLNNKMTQEVNTPSHEQCVSSHLERNASRDLLISLQKAGILSDALKIEEIKYLDPFEKE